MATDVPWNERFELDDLTVHYRWQGVPPGVKRIRDVEFKQIGGRALRLDILMPESADAPVPAIVWICGGGWQHMSRLGIENVSGWLAGEGYAIVGADYRVESEGRFPAQIEDCKAAVRWLRANADEYDIDPGRIGAWGDSAGGHLAELLGLTPGVEAIESEPPFLDVSSAPQAVCALYAPSDMRPYADARHAALFDGEPGSHVRERWIALASPIDHVAPGAPSHLLVHGDADEIVPLAHSTSYQEALLRAGAECTLAVLPGAGHDGHTAYGAEEVKALVAAFFERYL